MRAHISTIRKRPRLLVSLRRPTFCADRPPHVHTCFITPQYPRLLFLSTATIPTSFSRISSFSTFVPHHEQGQQVVHDTNPSNEAYVDNDDVTPSKSALFRRMQPHPAILRYIDSIGVGVPPRMTTKRRTALRDTIKTVRPGQSYMPPSPFVPEAKPIAVVGSVGVANSMATKAHNARKTKKHEFPRNEALTPEIALAGRSNVGKSTLLNAILYGNRNPDVMFRTRLRGKVPSNIKLPPGKKAIASDKPGETREITFYMLQHLQVLEKEVENRRLTLVDLPGYGFAYAKEEHRQEFQALMENYILKRGRALKRVLLLLDARHGLKKTDVDFLQTLQLRADEMSQEIKESNRVGVREEASQSKFVRLPQLPPIQVVLTKCDLVSQHDLAKRVAQVRQDLSDSLRREPSPLPILLVSARAGVGYNNVDRSTNRSRGGILEIQKELASLVTATRSPRKLNDEKEKTRSKPKVNNFTRHRRTNKNPRKH